MVVDEGREHGRPARPPLRRLRGAERGLASDGSVFPGEFYATRPRLQTLWTVSKEFKSAHTPTPFKA
eukprot:692647-Alexandrium_andersonii.AAC.1